MFNAIMVSERYHQKMFQNSEAFVFLAVIVSFHLGQRSRFQEEATSFPGSLFSSSLGEKTWNEVEEEVLHLSAHDFNYPKMLF